MVRSIPPFLLGILLAAYWGRVLRMAQKARRRTGRAANLVPGEFVGRVIRVVWFPLVAIWVIHPFVVALARALPIALRPVYFNLWIAWPMLLVAGMALYFSIQCWRAMGRHWRMGIDPAEKNPLIAEGPFARVRHPIYALSALLMLASVAMIPSPVMLLVGAIHISLLVWESRREEAHLMKVHGTAYAEYRDKVGAFTPRRIKWNGKGFAIHSEYFP
jgi:protein-S-isoprenylcysteine O-methyltransferase Ste14